MSMLMLHFHDACPQTEVDKTDDIRSVNYIFANLVSG
jgi:hypothetical protein